MIDWRDFMKIFIDAGHNFSGFNAGAVGNGMREQDITFDVSLKLAKILEAAGLTTRLSRPTLETNLGTDNTSAINARWQLANFWGADIFISIHANAGGGTGVEVIYGKDDSAQLARVVQRVYSQAMGLRDRRVWRRDDIGVVRHTKAPAILVELAFIDSPPSNPDVDILRNKRDDMAAALAAGLFEYLGIEPAKKEAAESEPTEKEPPRRYKQLDELPNWARPSIEKLVKQGYLKGDGDDLDLSMDMVRIFVVHDMAGLYDRGQ